MDAFHVLLVILALGACWAVDRRGRRRAAELHRLLDERHQLTATVLDSISDGVVLSDASGRLSLLNRAAKDWHGLPALDVSVDDLPARYDLYRTDGVTPLPPAESPLARAYAGESLRDEQIMICPAGLPKRRLLASGGPLYGPGMIKLGAVVTLRDMTGQLQAEQEARQALAIIENSSSILFKWRVAEDWPVEYVSENVNQFGYEASDFTEGRREFITIIHPEDRDRAENEVLERLASDAEGFFQQYRVVDAYGRTRWVDDWTRIIRDDRGRVTHMHGIVTDVTEREIIAGMLHDSEQRMELALSGAELGMWDWDIPSDRLVVNERWADMLGRLPEDLPTTSQEWVELIHPDERDAVRAHLRHHLESEEADLFETEYRLRRSDGTWAWILVRGKVLEHGESGAPVRMAGTHQDMTRQRESEAERESLEEQMRRTQKLESLGVLAGGIAHDFNNILMAVLGNAELARMELPDDAPALEFLTEIEQASEQAADLCNQMLAYSGKGRMRLRDVDLSGTVREITQMIGVSVSKKIRLVYDLADDLPTFHVDVSQIRQVIMNLITNAGEAIGDRDGEIRIRTGMQPDCTCGTPGCLFLEVEDTGCGMDEETRDRLFEPFFTTKFTGRGLGMAAVGGIVKAHGGRIEIDSEPGRGTRIRVILPGRQETQAEPGPAARAAAHPAGPSTLVLLVDDEEAVRRMGTRILETAGHRVLTAADGLEAVAAVQSEPRIGAVLMDVTMPRMDGVEAMAEMRRLRPDLPVVLSSGYHAESLADRMEPDTPFIQKPYRREELAAALAEALLCPLSV